MAHTAFSLTRIGWNATLETGVVTEPGQVQFWFLHLFRLDLLMNVGMCKINLRLPENLSLKGKRQVLKSITSRVRNKFNVSVAEVDNHDRWQIATIGVCCVSNDNRHANEMLSKVVDFVISSRFEAEILDYEIEILPIW
jgi:uncharacterized protein YlxP (DUF503 family)